ncbi:MAG: nitroreductase family protein [Prolixibacteraceae bacterium]|nr:nitroreductase family protein [Prolixibacteraceae bacterium]
MKLLKAHRTIRKYKKIDISDEIITDLLESGIRASNTGNMQLYSIIVTRSQEKKTLLAPLHFNQSMVIDAPLVLTICFDFKRFSDWCVSRNTLAHFNDLLWLLNGTIDASVLAQNICVAAESYGLGICYLGTTLYNTAEISEVLSLPVGVIPVTTLTVGYPEVVPELTDRLPLNAVVHFEEYKNYSSTDIAEIYKEKESLPSSMQFVIENKKTTLAQVFTEVRYKASDSDFFSVKLLKMLREQGFEL